MLIIALTGGIGSGKSTVSQLFETKGIPVIDTDLIARQITEIDKPAYHEILRHFGQDILSTGREIDRGKLRQIVFLSDDKRKVLEDILHPEIWKQVSRQLNSLPGACPYCIVVVPLLVESNTDTIPVKFNRILVIDSDEKDQRIRVIKRDNSDETIVDNIMKSQASRQQRNAVADDIILNNGSFEALQQAVEDMHQYYLQLA